jgi:hypothetical protein
MYAYCPMISHVKCGVSSNSPDSIDMKLIANLKKKYVVTNSLKYREGKPSYRKYDACYYEIGS